MSTTPESAGETGPGGTPVDAVVPEPDTEAQLEALRAENERLRIAAEQAPPTKSVEYLKARGAQRARGWRWVAAVIIFTLAGFVAPIAVAGVWVKAQVFDTDRYVATVAPLASNPGVQQAVADEITKQIFAKIDVDKIVDNALGVLVTKGVPSQLESLAPAISNGIKSFLSSEVLKLVQSDAFAQAWVVANTQAHTALVNALTGNTSNGVTVANNEVSVNMAAFIEAIKPQLVSAGVPFADKIPTVNATFVIFKSDNIGQVQQAASYLNTFGSIMPWVALLLLVAGVFVAPNRRRGLIVAASFLLAGMALLAAALALGRGWYAANLPAGVLDAQTASQVFDTVVAQLVIAIRTLCVFSIIVIIAALVAGPSRLAVLIREGLAAGNDGIRRLLHRENVPPSRVEAFVGRYRRVLEWVIVVLAFVIILLVSQPSTSFIVWISVLALVLVVVVELLGRPASEDSAPTPDPEVESSPTQAATAPAGVGSTKSDSDATG